MLIIQPLLLVFLPAGHFSPDPKADFIDHVLKWPNLESCDHVRRGFVQREMEINSVAPVRSLLFAFSEKRVKASVVGREVNATNGAAGLPLANDPRAPPTQPEGFAKAESGGEGENGSRRGVFGRLNRRRLRESMGQVLHECI